MNSLRQTGYGLKEDLYKSKNLRGWKLNSVVRHLPSKPWVCSLSPAPEKGRKRGGGEKDKKTGWGRSKMGKCRPLDTIFQQVPTSVSCCGGRGSASVPVRRVLFVFAKYKIISLSTRQIGGGAQFIWFSPRFFRKTLYIQLKPLEINPTLKSIYKRSDTAQLSIFTLK